MFIVKTICLCLIFWGLCYLGTGTDEKNLKGLSAYPDAIQRKVKNDSVLGPQVKSMSPVASFLSNLLLYTVLLLLICFFEREDGFFSNFWKVLVMGESLNLFDFFVIDLLWWRHTKRVRFTGTENQPELYCDPKNHLISFVKGIVMFFMAAVTAGLILSCFNAKL